MKLFQCSVQELHPRGRLWPLAKCLFATLLHYLPQLRSEYPSHSVLTVLAEKAAECDLSMSDLLRWSADVRDKFEKDNTEASHQNGETLIPVLLERIVILEKNAQKSHEVMHSK